ncbi:MAG: RND family transporter [Methanosarcinales archaeon]|nr:RND family transporter [Methanosarcinales archaeon]
MLILLVAFLLIFASFYGAGKISTESGTDTFVEKTSKLYQDFDYLYKQNFGTSAIIVLVESDDITDPEVLKAMDRLGTLMEGKKDVKGTFSIVTLIKDFASQQYGHSDIPEDKHTIQQIISHTPEEYLTQLMPDDRHAIVLIEMSGDVTTEHTEWVLSETKTAVIWANFPAGTSTIVTGEPAFMIAMQEEMNKSMGAMLAISGILMVVALLIAFRHVRWKLLPLPVVLIGIIYTFGAMGFTNVPMTMVSMAVFPILIGLGVDYAIQFHNRAEEELARGETASEAIIETIKHMGPAVGTAIIATSLGFVALFISPVPMIRDFGKMSLIGVVQCYFVSMFILMPVLYLLDSRAEKKILKKARRNGGNSKNTVKTEKIAKNGGTDGFGRFLGRFSITMAKNPLIVIGIASLLTIGGLYADEHVGVQTDTQKFVPQDMKPLLDFDKLNNLIGGSDQLNIIIKAEDVTDPAVIQWMDDFGRNEVEKQKDIISSDSLATAITLAYGSIPPDPSVVNSIMDGLPGTIKDRYVMGGDLGILNLKIAPNLRIEQTAALIENVKNDIEWYPPPTGVSTTVTGQQVAMTSILDALTSGRTATGYLGLTLIFFGLLVIYRDWMKAFVPILPILMVTGWSGGVMYLLGMEYNPLTATLGALVLGIGAEFTILMMERYFEERENGLLPMEAMETASSKIGQAIIASGFTVILGFSALIVTPFPMLSDFGVVTVIAVGFSLLSTLIVLPPIMVQLDIWRSKKNVRKNSSTIKI